MPHKIHQHTGKTIDISYDVGRCIHAEACVHGLPAVFDPARKPWIDPDRAPADAVTAVIHRCPTGALHYRRKDGGPAETADAVNTATVAADGPLYLRGDLEVLAPDGTLLLKDTRLALCRCGASKNKPFCDGAHQQAGFRDPGQLGRQAGQSDPAGAGGALRITPLRKGPLQVKGEIRLQSADGRTCRRATELYLCRCGGSANKPFCDGTHAKLGFTGQ